MSWARSLDEPERCRGNARWTPRAGRRPPGHRSGHRKAPISAAEASAPTRVGGNPPPAGQRSGCERADQRRTVPIPARDSDEQRAPVKLLYEKSRPGRRGASIPRHDLPPGEVPDGLRRNVPPRLPEVSEPELGRHVPELSTRNFGIDTGFYPLRSCTMKHNPRVNERLASLPGFAALHPNQDVESSQGALELMWRLQEALAEITGLDAVTLQPAAGSQGELLGLLLLRAYFADRGEQRNEVIVPDTAHGTNPASVTMTGYSLVGVATDARGNIDLSDLRSRVSERTAALMLTNPSTLGLFDEGIEQVTRTVHEAGGLCYYDGANLNAVCGVSRPGDMGFDIVHINLHKTFSQPHGGGGPGGGP